MRKERETPSAMTCVCHGVLPCDRAHQLFHRRIVSVPLGRIWLYAYDNLLPQLMVAPKLLLKLLVFLRQIIPWPVIHFCETSASYAHSMRKDLNSILPDFRCCSTLHSSSRAIRQIHPSAVLPSPQRIIFYVNHRDVRIPLKEREKSSGNRQVNVLVRICFF